MIKLDNVSKYYRTSNSIGLGLRKANAEFVKGEFVVITGESGSGKSTLINVISGLDNYEEGEMYLFGEETSHYTIDDWERYRALNIGFVAQNYNIIESYTVLQNVLLALELQDYPKEKRRERAIELIRMVDLENRLHHKAGKLSGGEKQRTVIARALAKDARVIVCDEPTGNLDSKSSKSIIKLIEKLSKDKLVIFVTHNFDEVKDVATRTIRLRDGEIIEDRKLKKIEKSDDFEQYTKVRKTTFSTLLNSAVRTLFATPRRLFFMLSLQIVITGIFIFIYAYLMFSGDLLVGELASNNDSSHRIDIVRRDGQPITDLSSFENNELIKSIVEYETIFEAYHGIGLVEDNVHATYALGRINMNDVSVLNEKDLVEGRLPNDDEVVLSAVSMELYDLNVGDQVMLLKAYTQFTKNPGDIYTISGKTLRGGDQSVYLHHAIFEDKALALDGLISMAGKTLRYHHYEMDPFSSDEPEIEYSTMNVGKFIFSDELEDDQIVIPSHLFPDPFSVAVTEIDIRIGSFYGVNYSFDTIDMSNISKTDVGHTDVYLSTTYQNILIDHFFNEDFEPTRITLNVHDITDGKELSKQLDHETYRVYYDVVALGTRAEIMTQRQFTFVSYLIVFIVGSLLYTILGVVLRNINASKRKDFSIFRSMGATRPFLARQVMLEQIMSGIIAFALVVTLLYFLSEYSYMISQSMRHVSLMEYAVLFIISILLSIQVSLGFNKKIFHFSVISSLNESQEAK